MDTLTGRIIYKGKARGQVLWSDQAIGFFGHVDVDNGIIKEIAHPLYGQSISRKILVFPRAKGSTVGSYILYALKKKGNAPAALIMNECELIVAVGAIISEIPVVDRVDVNKLKTADWVAVDGDQIEFYRRKK